jgi:glycerol-3-phosphate acyltransferase PlsY
MLVWTVFGFALGAVPFSVWLGRLFLHEDVRRYGDGNPGAASAWRAGTWRLGLPVLLLDFLKGALPVGVARFYAGVSGWGLVAVALAPVVGHAFSPLLGFRGGKAVAVSFGIWSGLTLWEGPIVLGFLLTLLTLTRTADAWTVMWGMLAFLAYWLLRRADLYTLSVWGGNMLILAWKHRAALRGQPMQPFPRLLRLLRRLP